MSKAVVVEEVPGSDERPVVTSSCSAAVSWCRRWRDTGSWTSMCS